MAKLALFYLGVTGALATIVLIAPWLAIIGFFALILPGLILSLAPTAFIWGCAFALFWFPLRALVGDWPALALSLPLAAILLWLPTRAENRETERRFASLNLPDIKPDGAITMGGHVLLREVGQSADPRWLANGEKDRDSLGRLCGPQCAALLFTNSVNTVTVERSEQGRQVERASFLLRPSGECRAQVLAPKATLGGDALTLYWQSRIDRGECIDRDDQVASAADITIELDERSHFGRSPYGHNWSTDPSAVLVKRLTISRGREVLLRRSAMVARRLTRLIAVVPEGGIEDFRFGLARRQIATPQSHWALDFDAELKRSTNIRLEADRNESLAQARVSLNRALDDPTGSPTNPVLLALSSYFRMFARFPTEQALAPTEDDARLLERLIADRRVTNFDQVGQLARVLGPRLAPMRPLIIDRIDAASDEEMRGLRPLAETLGAMPEDTFATLTPKEAALIDNPKRRRRALALVARLSDIGPAATPKLAQLLDEELRHVASLRTNRGSPYELLDVVNRAKVALCRLGPDGREALPVIEALERDGVVDRRIGEDRSWHLMLLRIGRPVDRIEKPANMSGSTENYRDLLRARLARFDPVRDCERG